jgi:hypothetical protein
MQHGLSIEARATLHGLYKRLRERGEDAKMLRRAISVHPIEANVVTARQLLLHHRRISELMKAKQQLRSYNLLWRVHVACRIRQHNVALFRMRLVLLSWAALSDLLVLLLCGAVLMVIYQMYRLCRVGLTRAEDKYNAMSIPIIQSIEALELAEQYRNQANRRSEMEKDILRERQR